MKKKLFLFISIVAMSLMIGCSKSSFVYRDYTEVNTDNSLYSMNRKEANVELNLNTDTLRITSFDGRYVNWNKYSAIHIEPGKHTFELKGEYQPSSVLDFALFALSSFKEVPDYEEVVIQGEYNFVENNSYTITEVRNTGWFNDGLSYEITSVPKIK